QPEDGPVRRGQPAAALLHGQQHEILAQRGYLGAGVLRVVVHAVTLTGRSPHSGPGGLMNTALRRPSIAFPQRGSALSNSREHRRPPCHASNCTSPSPAASPWWMLARRRAAPRRGAAGRPPRPPSPP